MTNRIRNVEQFPASERLHFDEWGSGNRTIVFLHGLGGTSRYWLSGEASVRNMGLQARCIFVDLLGFGLSPKPWCHYTLDRHVNALETVLLGQGPIEIVGHSMGAAVALAYAARHPQQVNRIVLFSLPYFQNQQRAYRWMRRKPEGWLYTNAVVTALCCIMTRRVVAWLLPRVIRDLPREVVKDLVKHTFCSAISSLWNVIYRYDLKQEAEKLSSLTNLTFVHAKDDATAPFCGAVELAWGHREWKFVALESGDHHIWHTQTRQCWRIVQDPELKEVGGCIVQAVGP